MQFIPAWFTSGVTANKAAAGEGAVEPGQPVPNDNYRVEEGHRLLTYLLPADAKVTVLTRQGDPANFGSTPITVAQLAEIVGGKNPVEAVRAARHGRLDPHRRRHGLHARPAVPAVALVHAASAAASGSACSTCIAEISRGRRRRPPIAAAPAAKIAPTRNAAW